MGKNASSLAIFDQLGFHALSNFFALYYILAASVLPRLLDGGKIVLRLDDEIDYEGGDYGEGLVFTIGEDCADET